MRKSLRQLVVALLGARWHLCRGQAITFPAQRQGKAEPTPAQYPGCKVYHREGLPFCMVHYLSGQVVEHCQDDKIKWSASRAVCFEGCKVCVRELK